MQVVIVDEATYRGEAIQGTFQLVKGFTAFVGEVDHRRNGRKGTGFIKVMPEGEQLTRLAPNLARPVKLSVIGEDAGYRLVGATHVADAFEGLPAGVGDSLAAVLFETVAPEFGVDAERELATASQLVSELDALRGEFAAAKGRERDNLRKRLRRMEAKVGAV